MDNRSILRGRNLIVLAVVDAVLFLIANVTAKSSSHPGTLSNIVFEAFLIGLALLIGLCVAALVQRRRTAARAA